jgi:hypothetical protein
MSIEIARACFPVSPIVPSILLQYDSFIIPRLDKIRCIAHQHGVFFTARALGFSGPSDYVIGFNIFTVAQTVVAQHVYRDCSSGFPCKSNCALESWWFVSPARQAVPTADNECLPPCSLKHRLSLYFNIALTTLHNRQSCINIQATISIQRLLPLAMRVPFGSYHPKSRRKRVLQLPAPKG